MLRQLFLFARGGAAKGELKDDGEKTQLLLLLFL